MSAAFTGIGALTEIFQSVSSYSCIGPEGQKAMLQPFAAPIQINLWGGNLLSQSGATINIPSISLQSRNIITQMGYDFRKGLEKKSTRYFN